MTGTAATEESEFISMYNTPVAIIPTNKKVIQRTKKIRFIKQGKKRMRQLSMRSLNVMKRTACSCWYYFDREDELLSKLLQNQELKF